MRSGEHLKKWQAPSATDAPPSRLRAAAAIEASFRQEMLMTQEAWERNCCSIQLLRGRGILRRRLPGRSD